MRTLYLIRHAKSSWSNTDLHDFERPLNERGLADAPKMGKRLKEKEVYPDLMLSSPAVRALTTCKSISSILGYPVEQIKTDRDLYHADEDALLSAIQNLEDHHKIVCLFGHNPGITEFANQLFDIYIDNIPTAGIIAGNLPVEHWSDAQFKCGKFLFFDFPKRNIRE